jgi:hypothetical protein
MTSASTPEVEPPPSCEAKGGALSWLRAFPGVGVPPLEVPLEVPLDVIELVGSLLGAMVVAAPPPADGTAVVLVPPAD